MLTNLFLVTHSSFFFNIYFAFYHGALTCTDFNVLLKSMKIFKDNKI